MVKRKHQQEKQQRERQLRQQQQRHRAQRILLQSSTLGHGGSSRFGSAGSGSFPEGEDAGLPGERIAWSGSSLSESFSTQASAFKRLISRRFSDIYLRNPSGDLLGSTQHHHQQPQAEQQGEGEGWHDLPQQRDSGEGSKVGFEKGSRVGQSSSFPNGILTSRGGEGEIEEEGEGEGREKKGVKEVTFSPAW